MFLSVCLSPFFVAKLMVRRRISYLICYITFKRMLSFKEQIKSYTHLLAPGPAGFKGGFVRKFMLLLDGISMDGG